MSDAAVQQFADPCADSLSLRDGRRAFKKAIIYQAILPTRFLAIFLGHACLLSADLKHIPWAG